MALHRLVWWIQMGRIIYNLHNKVHNCRVCVTPCDFHHVLFLSSLSYYFVLCISVLIVHVVWFDSVSVSICRWCHGWRSYLGYHHMVCASWRCSILFDISTEWVRTKEGWFGQFVGDFCHLYWLETLITRRCAAWPDLGGNDGILSTTVAVQSMLCRVELSRSRVNKLTLKINGLTTMCMVGVRQPLLYWWITM